MHNIALIFAGGVGRRMKSGGLPKQFLKVNGVPIIIHTLRNFEDCSEITDIVIVSVEKYIDYVWQLVKEYKITKVKNVVPGGQNGQESIYHGLCAANELKYENPIVLIHDGVRPLIDYELIVTNIESVKKYGSSISCVPEKETIVTVENNVINEITEKSKTYIARAPQCFFLKDIFEAHNRALKEGITDFIDSCTLMKYYGYPLHIVLTDSSNIKITTPEDYYILKALLELKENEQVLG